MFWQSDDSSDWSGGETNKLVCIFHSVCSNQICHITNNPFDPVHTTVSCYTMTFYAYKNHDTPPNFVYEVSNQSINRLDKKKSFQTNMVKCGRIWCTKKGTLLCGGCRQVSYCSKECQTAHWKHEHHQDKCKKMHKWYHSLVCGITHEYPVHPVVTVFGQLYERSAIETWLQSHNTDPMLNQPLPSKTLMEVKWSKFANEGEWKQWLRKVRDNTKIWSQCLTYGDTQPERQGLQLSVLILRAQIESLEKGLDLI